MKYRKVETALAWFSLAGAFVHFVLETLYHVTYGQFLPFLLVDYIAVGLLVYAGVLSLRTRPASAAGLLAGAWGFAACLAYIACFVFVERYLQGEGPLFLVVILGAALAAAFVAFATALRLVKAAMTKAPAPGREPGGGQLQG